MCSGRVDPVIILAMFENGADGVIVAGCHPGDCHYISGNLYEERKIKMLKMLLGLTGLDMGRLRLEWVSAAEGQRFAQVVTEFTEQIRNLGPSPISGEKIDQKILLNVQAAENAAAGTRVRVLVGREIELTEKANVYKEKVPQETFDLSLRETVESEFVRQKIYLLTRAEPMSVKALAEATDLAPASVLKQIVNMRRRNMIAVDRVKDTTPLYRALGAS
jgi:coenzyme F420-reducing hydrogenase delta subunit